MKYDERHRGNGAAVRIGSDRSLGQMFRPCAARLCDWPIQPGYHMADFCKTVACMCKIVLSSQRSNAILHRLGCRQSSSMVDCAVTRRQSHTVSASRHSAHLCPTPILVAKTLSTTHQAYCARNTSCRHMSAVNPGSYHHLLPTGFISFSNQARPSSRVTTLCGCRTTGCRCGAWMRCCCTRHKCSISTDCWVSWRPTSLGSTSLQCQLAQAPTRGSGVSSCSRRASLIACLASALSGLARASRPVARRCAEGADWGWPSALRPSNICGGCQRPCPCMVRAWG
jgi:hypothetical protein